MATGEAWVEGATAVHLARVLRACPGQEYELAHAGQVYLARILAVQPQEVRFALLESLPATTGLPIRALAAALFKFDRFEWMIEKATELGLTRLQPVVAQRTDPHLAAAAAKRVARWQVIALEAAQQSRRSEAPEILPPLPLAKFLSQPPAGIRIFLSEEPGAPLPPAAGALVLASGPEGGWTAQERTAWLGAGFTPAWLGPRILRCETAILAALARSEPPITDPGQASLHAETAARP